MKLKRQGKTNAIEVDKGDRIVLFSYSTAVAVRVRCEKGSMYFRTAQKYSVTTTRQINKWLDGRSAGVVSQAEIDRLAGGGGVMAATEKELLDVIEGLVIQFAYSLDNPPRLGTMGLSALEDAFQVLGWEDPHPVPEMGCDEPGCGAHAVCGWPSPQGYRRTCSEHAC